MARIAKTGLEYFPFDIDFFQDIQIRKLIKRQGGKAVTVYALLLCIIYKNGYYMRWDNELPFVCSESTGFDEAYISEAIKSCLMLGLFDKNLFDTEQVLTSKGIQERYRNIQHVNKRLAGISEYRLVDDLPAPPKRKPRPTAVNKKAPAAKPAAAPRAAKVGNAEYLKHFFAENRKESLTALCKKFGLAKKTGFADLRKLADEVIAEWELSDLTHADFTDWSRHLISTMRIKLDSNKKKQSENPAPVSPADYSFDGGFGGQDI